MADTRSNAPTVPVFTEHKIAGPLREYFNVLNGWLQREFRRRPEKDVALDGIYLTAPNGSIYQLSVSNAGAAVFTLVSS